MKSLGGRASSRMRKWLIRNTEFAYGWADNNHGEDSPRGGHATATSPSTSPGEEPDNVGRVSAMPPPPPAKQAEMALPGPSHDSRAFARASSPISPRTVLRRPPSSDTTAAEPGPVSSSNKRRRTTYNSYEAAIPGRGGQTPLSLLQSPSQSYDHPYPEKKEGHGEVGLARPQTTTMRHRPWESDFRVAAPTSNRPVLPPLEFKSEPRWRNTLKRRRSPDE